MKVKSKAYLSRFLDKIKIGYAFKVHYKFENKSASDICVITSIEAKECFIRINLLKDSMLSIYI